MTTVSYNPSGGTDFMNIDVLFSSRPKNAKYPMQSDQYELRMVKRDLKLTRDHSARAFQVSEIRNDPGHWSSHARLPSWKVQSHLVPLRMRFCLR